MSCMRELQSRERRRKRNQRTVPSNTLQSTFFQPSLRDLAAASSTISGTTSPHTTSRSLISSDGTWRNKAAVRHPPPAALSSMRTGRVRTASNRLLNLSKSCAGGPIRDKDVGQRA